MANNPFTDLSKMMLGGAAIVVATCSQEGRPAITRGWGPTYDQASSALALLITAPAGSPTLVNLETNGAIAVTVSEPLTYQTVQMKGRIDHIGSPSSEDRLRAGKHLDRFLAEVAQLGVKAGAADLFLGDFREVSFVVEELYDQTPGRHAGTSLL